MASRRAGIFAIACGLIVALWAWFGYWPLAAPVYGVAADYSGLHGLSFAVALTGILISFVGLALAIAGRGGPRDWGNPGPSDE